MYSPVKLWSWFAKAEGKLEEKEPVNNWLPVLVHIHIFDSKYILLK